MSDKFGEHRPEPRREMDLQPLKIQRACTCPDHIMLEFSVNIDTYSNPLEAVRDMLQGKEPEVAKQWVPIIRVLTGYN